MNQVDTAATAAPGAPAPPAPATRFVGRGRTFLWLLVRGAMLLAVTLGIYRFWLATDVRRFLWSNTEVGGETLEYTGTATELLIGFLIAVALLVPLYAVIFVIALSAGPAGDFVGILAFPVLAFLGHFAIYRARRYRLTRTIYRGVRCHQTGSAWAYAVRALLWWVLILLTLGLAYPFAQSRLERYKMRHTWYGNLQGRFAGTGASLFMRGLPMWLVVVGPTALALIFAGMSVDWLKVGEAATAAMKGENFIGRLGEAYHGLYVATGVTIGAVSFSVVLAAILFPVFQAMMLRWWLSGLRFGGLTARSHLRTGQIYGAYLRFLLYSFLFTLAASAVGIAGLIGMGMGLAAVGRPEISEVMGAAAAVAFYVAMMLGYSTIYQATVKLSIWRVSVESLDFEGLSTLDRVRAEGAPSSAVGEGLADALNVGGF